MIWFIVILLTIWSAHGDGWCFVFAVGLNTMGLQSFERMILLYPIMTKHHVPNYMCFIAWLVPYGYWICISVFDTALLLSLFFHPGVEYIAVHALKAYLDRI
jgi:hypothetical protein